MWSVVVPAVSVATLVALSTALRAWVALRAPTPWINADEIVYTELGRSLYASAHFQILGQPTRFYSLVYPALVGGPLSLPNLDLGYRLLKVVQALVMSATCIPVYLWSRAMMPRRWAVAAAVLTLTLPGLAYSALVMTEVAFFPIAVLAAWAIARALVRPTARRQALATGAILFAAATRLQAIVLLPAFAAAIALYAVFSRSPRRVLHAHVPALSALAIVAGGWSALQLASGGPATNVLGAYRAAGEASYSLASVARFAVYHFADALLLTMIVPVCATTVLATRAARRREHSPDVNAFVAVTVAFAVVLVLEVGTFASRHVGRLAERDLLALAPLFLIGFALWLARGAPVTRTEAAATATAVLAVFLYLPVGSLVTQAAIPDAFTLAPLYQLRTHASHVNLDLLLPNLALPLIALFAFPPRRRAWIVAACVGALLVGTSVSASYAVVHESRTLKPELLARDNRWIDRSARGNVTYLYAGESRWNAVYENIFWNRRIDHVDDIGAFVVPGPVPQTPVGPRQDGLVVRKHGVPEHAHYLVATTTIVPFGAKIADAGSADLALWRLRQPFRLALWITGMELRSSTLTRAGDFHATADAAGTVRLVDYACSRDALRLTLTATAPAVITLLSDEHVWLRRRVPAWRPTSFFVPDNRKTRGRHVVAAHIGRTGGLAPGTPPMRQCTFDIESTTPLRVNHVDLVRHA